MQIHKPLLNDYLSGLTDVVFAHDVARARGEQPDHADRAVACAVGVGQPKIIRSTTALGVVRQKPIGEDCDLGRSIAC